MNFKLNKTPSIDPRDFYVQNNYMRFTPLLFLASIQALAQNQTFTTPYDKIFDIQNVSVIKTSDNVKGLYASSSTNYLVDLVKQDKDWKFQALVDQDLKPEELMDKADSVKKVCEKTKSDTLLSSRIQKSEKSSRLNLYLFSCADGLLLINEENPHTESFDFDGINKALGALYNKIKTRLPYQGEILSRKEQMVTINLGVNDGLKVNDELTAVKIFKMNRHPKFNFLISSEREIIGKIKLYKVEDELSFGAISSERDKGAIQPKTKLLSNKFVEYPEMITQDGTPLESLSQSKDKDVSFGDKPTAWLPEPDPTFGALYLGIGLGQYSHSMDVVDVESFESNSKLTPVLAAGAELWINTHWNLDFNFKQNILSVKNPRSGTPDELTLSLGQFHYQVGYNFLIADDFWGPKFTLLFGLAQFKQTSDSSTPRVYTSQSYSAYDFAIDGSIPLTEYYPITMGGYFHYYYSPSMSETPVTSGSSNKPTLTSFGFYTNYHMRRKLNLKFSLNFDNLHADISGTGSRSEQASSTNTKLTDLQIGLQYMF